MKQNDLFLSIVIPTYNEEDRLPPTLRAALNYLEKHNFCSEIIISDDGSDDKTLSVAKSVLGNNENHQFISNPVNCGKGDAVRRGVLAARGDLILFTDADLCAPFETLDEMLPLLLHPYDLIIGTRHHPKSHIIVRQSRLRTLMGNMYVFLANKILQMTFTDINCGFKLFSRQSAHFLFQQQKQKRWGFDAEILFLAKQNGFCIGEIPITWAHQENSKVRPLRDAITSLFCLYQTRLIHVKPYRENGNCNSYIEVDKLH